MNLAIVGCGFVADYYLATLPCHPELNLLGVMDRDAERARKFSEFHRVPVFTSLEELLNDGRVEMVLNLTNPRSHFEISKAALERGKHVYSEKPLAMELVQARELIALADKNGLLIASAPCSLLGETAQTLWRALREDAVGPVRLVYAEMDDGMVHLMQYQKWLSESGIPWPSKDEFEIGCTLEHAGYYLAWLVAFFGPAQSVTSFASVQVKDKRTAEPLNMESPDFSVACIQFQSGIVARLTCSILAPHDHTLRIVGDKGVLYTEDSWLYKSPVYSRKMVTIRRKTFLNPIKTRYRLAKAPYPEAKTKGSQSMDFSRGPAEVAAAIREGRPCRLSNHYSLHVNELALAIHYAREQGSVYEMTTSFEPIAPMDWAE
ncbi:MAG: Gfo/Idh/MocA family oxidoreductase [Planctomycetales bacterium]|nr:Gfo/Idh/MocA family oxidoreductase [Planctomycetales bacterium]